MRTRTIGISPEMPCPQSAEAPGIAGEHGGRRPQRRVRVEDLAGEILKEVGFIEVHAQMA